MTQTVLITGSSSGFGEATARLFARRGWHVIATMRRPDAGHPLAALPNVVITRLDVEDSSSIESAVNLAINRFGGIDVLVNNAGFGLFGVFEATPPAKIREQFDVNLFGVMEVTRAVLPHFRARRSGSIVNIGSGAGVFALPMSSLYCASKFALEGFTEALWYELSALGIKVRMIEPGGVTSTRFGERVASEATGVSHIPDYDAFTAATGKVFERLRSERGNATAEGVATVIFDAATDTSNRLRYVATDDIKPWVSARRETSEDTYMDVMRASVMPQI